MNGARATELEASAPGTGAEIVAPAGTLPTRTNTVRAEVLCRLLAGEKLTGLEVVFRASTTRLAAAIHALTSAYGWTIERADKVVGCKDGRSTRVAQHHLLPSIIGAAMRDGAATRCAEVRIARAALRSNAADALRKAVQANAAQRNRIGPALAAQIEMVYG